MSELSVTNEELRTVREAMREMTAILRQLEQGDVEKIVLTRGGRMVGVLLSPERYSSLLDAAS
jgi:PHD/YefM family antitoxin component YafN of YafNO toxin-antitoxin module